jgi:dolichol-phosphate mannosyltransferase
MATGDVDHGLFTVIIPTFNEAGNVGNMVEELFRLYPGIRVVIVDDGSSDGTAETVQALEGRYEGLALLQRAPREKGLTASVMDGILSIDTDKFVVMDCDFQHPPAAVKDLMAAVHGGADMVVAVREGMGPLCFSRRIASNWAHRLAHTYLWFHRRPCCSDMMSGFFASDTRMVKEAISQNEASFEKVGFKVLFDILKHVPRNIRLEEVRYNFGDRASGESKLSTDVILSVLRQCGLGGKVASGTIHFFLINKAGRSVVFIILAAIFAIVISSST